MTVVAALTALGVSLLTLLGVLFTARQNTVAARRTAETIDRGKLTDDLQEEVVRLRENTAAANAEVNDLRFKLRTLYEYADLCVAVLRRNNIEPPPVPAAVRHPWEST